MDARQIIVSRDTADVSLSGGAMQAVGLGLRALSLVAPELAARAVARLWLTPARAEIRQQARAFLSTGERFVLRVDGRDVAAWRWGTGPRVILMHGWGGNGAQMRAFVEPLTRAGFQAITFDAPAHGASGPSRLGARRCTLFDFAAALRTLLNDRPPVAGVIAHSGGCTAAAWTVVASPASCLPGMIFIAPMASPIHYRTVFQRALLLSDDVMRRFTRYTEQELGFRWEDLDVPAMAARARTPPLLVVHDRDDLETPWSDGDAIARTWPGARLHTTVGLGHRRILRDAAIIEEVVRFLKTPAT